MRPILLLLLLSTAACQRSNTNYVSERLTNVELSTLSDYEKDSLSIVSSIKVFVEGVKEKDIDKLLSIYHPDFLYTYPTRRRSLEVMRKEYEEAFENEKFVVEYPEDKVIEIKIIGSSAYTVVNWNFTISSLKDEKIIRNRFYRDIQVWQKQEDGRWLMIRAWQYPLVG